MMKNKALMFIAIALTVGSTLGSMAARKDEITLVMVPREEEAVRLGMDLAEKFGSMVLSYKVGADQAFSLHGWTGTQWVKIRPEAFKKGDFFRVGPGSAVIVEEAGKTVPQTMIPAAEWCPAVSKVTTTEMRPLLHLTGRYYDFSYKDWKWFAKRYSMTMDEINPEGLNVAWYHRRLGENLALHQQVAYDQQYWVTVRRPAKPKPVAPVVEETPADAEVAENPLTNEAPAAVIMAPGDAEETKVETEEGDAAPVAEEVKVETVPAEDVGTAEATDAAAEETAAGEM